jgi:hypothetical protein
MERQDEKQDKIRYHAEKALFYTDLLITQCDSWLPAEVGNENMIAAIRKRKKGKRSKRLPKIFRIFRQRHCFTL